MASSYPGGLDAFTNPTASDTLDSATVPHADQHSNANDAIEAIESTLGVNPQGGSATVVARLTALDSTVAGKETPSGAQAKADAAQAAAISTASADATTKANAAEANATAVANTKVASVTAGDSSVTVAGTSTAPTVAVNQSNLTIAQSQVTDLVSDLAGKAPATGISPSAITGTAVITSDARLGDARPPTDGSVTDAKIAVSGLSPSVITGTAVVKNPTSTQTITNSTAGIVPLAISQNGAAHTLSTSLAASAGEDTTALNVVSSNELSSAMWLTGKERGHGTLKIAHVQPDAASDANAGAISINLHPSFDYQSVIGTASFSSGATSVTFTTSSGAPTVGQQFKGTGIDSRTLITAVTGTSSPFTLTINIAATSNSDAGEYRTFTPTAAQGIFIDTYKTPGGTGYTSSGTTGSLLNLRNGGNAKLVLNANGQLQLPQTGATGGLVIGGDTVLYRAAAGVLRTNDIFYMNNTTTDSTVLCTSVTSGIATFVTPFALKNTGKLEWGQSGSTRDTFLYRSSAGTLKTDGAFVAASIDGGSA